MRLILFHIEGGTIEHIKANLSISRLSISNCFRNEVIVTQRSVTSKNTLETLLKMQSFFLL